MELNYKEQGSGIPVIVIHGLFGSLDNWQIISKQLAQSGYRVISLDLRNHGKSDHSKDFSFELMAEDIIEMINVLDLKNPILLGHSMGGKVAIKTAIKYTEILSGIIVVDIAPRYYPPHHSVELDAMKNIPLENISSRNQAVEFMSRTIKNDSIVQFLLKNLQRTDEGFKWKINLEVLEDKIENIGEEISSESKITTPALFIKGEKSNYIGKSDDNHIKKIFDKVQIITCKDASHWVHADNPECLISNSLKFLNQVTDLTH